MPIFAPVSDPCRDFNPLSWAGGQQGLVGSLLIGAAHPAYASRAATCCGHRQPSPSGQAICLCSHPNYLLRDAHCQPVGV